MRPSYSATAIVYVSPIFPTALGDDHDHDRQYDSFIEQQVTAATRYETLQKALEKYPDAWPKLFPQETEQNQIIRLQKTLKVEQVGHSYEVSISLEERPAGLARQLRERDHGTVSERRPRRRGLRAGAEIGHLEAGQG